MGRQQVERVEAVGVGLDPSRPLMTQVSRFDRWKDPLGVIAAYRLAKERIPELQLALVGVIEAQDDPEAFSVLREVAARAAGDPDIHMYSDPLQVGDVEVNAFQTGSEVVVQMSLREGFGLTVAEAMWKGTPVVGQRVGGIALQIRDGENGFLVDTTAECAERVVALVRDAGLVRRIGKAGRESVRERYLLPRLAYEYLQLFHEVASGARDRRIA